MKKPTIITVYSYIALALAVLTLPSIVSACGASHFTFGDSVRDTVKKYDIDTLFAAAPGTVDIPVRGHQICKNIPEGTQGVLVFIDDALVQAKFTLTNDGQQLLSYFESLYGDIKKRGEEDKGDEPKKEKDREYFWADKTAHMVMYATRMQGEERTEYVEISSRAHADKFRALHVEREEALNESLEGEATPAAR
ncbi:MAG: hypothetical protein GC136_03430 [Alphaproteobacteria bacterium]|nr:hypothetical protein [Alphaproteobacteria bacterium]